MRIAVTGAGGRLGSALIEQLHASSPAAEVLAWDLLEHDLDDPISARRLVSRHHPDLVVHTAAWTDVDGCANDPALALRRNGTATGEMAEACVENSAGLIAISTNEVFDGLREDGQGYLPTDAPRAANPYGAAKLGGERLARVAFGAVDPEFEGAAVSRWARLGVASGPSATEPSASGPSPDQQPASLEAGWDVEPEPLWSRLAIVRTAWLFGPPGPDFPTKILAAADRARAEQRPLDLVADEIGSPTYARDLAGGLAGLVAVAASDRPFGGIYHVVNAGHASRAEWAREVLRLAGLDLATRDVSMTRWPRPSTPPRWGVLEPTPLPGPPLREWRQALAEYLEQRRGARR